MSSGPETVRYSAGIILEPHSPDWARQFRAVADALEVALSGLLIVSIEHVGSTAIPDLPAKPILDIDIIVQRDVVPAAIEALERAGYAHRGDLGVPDRAAFAAPDETPSRNVYLCVDGTLHLRNHLAVRAALLTHPALRDRYGAVKRQLAGDPSMNIHRYVAGKSAVLRDILAVSDLTAEEKDEIYDLNTRSQSG
ncbi:GrpB family protein [Arthrobacter pityocampae]|uniref:GrpB family protein n=1 Tax=Arthrobacter pityocampae TaxID=547334 RepID=A0A2S5J012_9MICC|nr:GrpB family protein [Arthrobacter pityocampae]PPB50149.1 GrpB family protein [Arthrobacter pityocampae]